MATSSQSWDHPLAPICAAWNEKIRLAKKFKKKRFQDDANDAMNFFNGPHDFQYGSDYAKSNSSFTLGADEEVPTPSFKMTVNRVAEMVQLFGPVLYHKNPIRQVNPRKVPSPPIEMFGNPQDPNVQMAFLQMFQQIDQERNIDKTRALIMEFYLNYTPDELGLKDESRRAIDEAIIKGAGILWTEIYQPKGSTVRMIGSFYDTVDNLGLDPDVETIGDCKWIYRECCHPVWEIEDEYGIPRGTLKGNLQSLSQQGDSAADEDGDFNRKRGQTYDLLTYYKVYSKMGVGSRLKGVPPQMAEVLDTFGDYCYLVIVPDLPYPLNLPSELIEQAGADQDILKRLEWPTPFWADDTWPFTPIIFHEIPRSVWPMSHLKPAMGEMLFINWAYSFVASKIKITSRDFLAIKKAAGEEIKQAVLSGGDLTLIELTHEYKSIADVVGFLQHPQFNGDVWKVIEAVEHNFEKRVGLTELVYGMSQRQMRSAEEAGVKSAQIQVRPDDMANKVENAMTAVARKEALAARWHLKPKDVAPIMGPIGAQLWGQLVAGSDIFEVVHELEYRIEAGSTRKPNKDRDANNMQQAMQTLFGPMMAYAQATMDFTAINQLIGDWAKSIDLDPTKYLFRPPPAPPPGTQPPTGGKPAQPQQAKPPALPQPVNGKGR